MRDRLFSNSIGRHVVLACLAALCASVSACNLPAENGGTVAASGSLAHVPYVQRPLSESWVYAKDARLLVERATTRVREQRILLRNRTSLRGDNFIFLRTVDLPRYGVAPRLAQDDLIAHAGGRPPPFDRVDAKLVNSLNDSIGAVTWAEWTDGAGTFCVLAVRRLDDTARVLTYGADVMDVLMRNCSGGSFDAALAPIMDAAIAFPPASGARGAGPRNLSPLAAPMP